MGLWQELRGLNAGQIRTVAAAYLGWTLDAFDYFLMVFMLKPIAEAFGTGIPAVSEALFLTLAARPLGAFVFGWLADRIGRRPVLIVVILSFSLLSALSGFARTLSELLLIRALFGFAMGGEWGIGASLAMETIPARLRGVVSGLLQSGYPSGFLLASLAYYLCFDALGWRQMFLLGLAPAALVLFIRWGVAESPVWQAGCAEPRANPLRVLAEHGRLALYLVVLMTAFMFFSHGTQDLYPTFLQKQHHFDTTITGRIAIVMNMGAICGALLFGSLSERLGRKRTIVTSALLALPVIPFWAYGSTPLVLACAAFAMQAFVQGAWSMVPAHLNELSPPLVRAMFPGLVYQLGSLLSARSGPWQTAIASANGDNYGLALASMTIVTVLVLALWCWIGPEKRGVAM